MTTQKLQQWRRTTASSIGDDDDDDVLWLSSGGGESPELQWRRFMKRKMETSFCGSAASRGGWELGLGWGWSSGSGRTIDSKQHKVLIDKYCYVMDDKQDKVWDALALAKGRLLKWKPKKHKVLIDKYCYVMDDKQDKDEMEVEEGRNHEDY
ncbi:hypothetical protein PIB30_068278 [Stylosanthes scabra]|uniref:Uncharacterized protein n=1 Tax=Stylosanthes scabra TaxID=79078 RepID=A0ABU6QQ07_9FABA|nr:hypothetical protein [Stylosanthes scabra]